MRTSLVVAMLLVPAVGSAAPKFVTIATVDAESLRSAVTKVGVFDACWTKAGRAKARVVVDAGKLTKVAVETDDTKAVACVTRVLRAIKLAPGARIDTTISFDVLDPSTAAIGKLEPLDKGAGTGAPPDGGKALSQDTINRTIVRRAAVFRKCYTTGLASDPKLSGNVTVHFEIVHGAVKNAAIAKSSTMPSTTVRECIRASVAGLKFPDVAEPATVNYPFVFTQAG